MSVAVSSALLLWGLVAVALAMDRQHEQWLHRRAGPRLRRVLRVGGTAAIAISLACAVAGLGGALGVLTWLGLLTPAALAVAGALTWLAPGPAARRR